MNFYITVKINGGQYFINKDMDYTDRFDDVLLFERYSDAEQHIRLHNLSDKANISVASKE